MEIVISHLSAFLFWRRFTGDISCLQRIPRPKGTSRGALQSPGVLRDLDALKFNFSPLEPLDVLYRNAADRTKASGIRAHVCKHPLPSKSIIRLTESVSVVSPELCFAQLETVLPETRHLLAGFEFCGTYAVDENEELISRKPLASTAAITKTVRHFAPHHKGRSAHLLPYILDNAASPMEAKLALLLSLPYRKGGYGLPAPILNAPIALSKQARTLYPHETCRADLFWPETQLDLEYDGEAFHEGAHHANDIARRNALEQNGVAVISVCRNQLGSKEACDLLAHRIAQTLGVRIQPRCDSFAEKQTQLRKALGIERLNRFVA